MTVRDLKPLPDRADNAGRGPILNPTRVLASGAAILALVLCVVGGSKPANAQDYPRLGLYGSMFGDGYPLWDVNGVLQDTTLNAMARYHEVILDASPITPYRPDAAAALRARRPGIRLYAYVVSHDIWPANNPDSTIHFPTRMNRLVRDLGGYLYDTSGNYFPGSRINLAKRDAGGNYVVAEGLADLFQDAIVRTGIWDGIFLDVYCKSILWMETPGERIDYARAGYPSLSAFDAAWGVAVDTLGNRLRRLAGDNFELIGNCAQSTNYASFNGWMRENFPYQNGGDWYQNMFRDPGGYFVDDTRFRAPRSNYLFSASASGNPYDANNRRKARFGLASAALGEGYGVFGPSDRSARPLPYHMWWFDEYGVDLTTGAASPAIQHTGWLGQPLGPYGQMVWVGTQPDAVSNPDFETDVTTGWTFYYTQPGATRTQDLSTSASGSASLKLHVPSAGAVPWEVNVHSEGTVFMLAGQIYSATFWAKASSGPHRIHVVAESPGGGELTSATLDVTTSWKHYSVALVPPSAGDAELELFVADAAGDVWFDDVHLQAGATSVYRRDFQNGIVLVNPSNEVLTVPLEREFKKIQGFADPVTNDGSLVTQVTVNPSDALFLIGDDRIAPATTQDLQVGPAWQPHSRARRPAPSGAAPSRP